MADGNRRYFHTRRLRRRRRGHRRRHRLTAYGCRQDCPLRQLDSYIKSKQKERKNNDCCHYRRQEYQQFVAQGNCPGEWKSSERNRHYPGLAVILVGDDPASETYVRNKERSTVKVGMYSEVHRLPAETSQQDLLNLVNELNNDPQNTRHPGAAAFAPAYR